MNKIIYLFVLIGIIVSSCSKPNIEELEKNIAETVKTNDSLKIKETYIKSFETAFNELSNETKIDGIELLATINDNKASCKWLTTLLKSDYDKLQYISNNKSFEKLKHTNDWNYSEKL